MKINSINLFKAYGAYCAPSFKGNKASADARNNSYSEFDGLPRLVFAKKDIVTLDSAGESKRTTAKVINSRLSSMVENEISEETRKECADEIENFKNGIIYNFISVDNQSKKEFSFDEAIKHFDAWHNYVEKENRRLSYIMLTPYELIHKEGVPIAVYAKNNPDDPRSELLMSKLYKMYKLTTLNKYSGSQND